MTPDVDLWGVAASLLLIAAAMALSWREGLRLERSIAWAATRATVQLGAIGAGLGLVLADDAPIVWSWLWHSASNSVRHHAARTITKAMSATTGPTTQAPAATFAAATRMQPPRTTRSIQSSRSA